MKASWESFLYLIDLFHSFAGTVKQIVHKAFWDRLESELNEDPPEYEHAIKLFEEIKEVMFLLPCIPILFCQLRSRTSLKGLLTQSSQHLRVLSFKMKPWLFRTASRCLFMVYLY